MPITWVARAAFSSWESWRSLRPSSSSVPRAGRAPRSGPVGGDHADRRVERVLEPGLEQQRHLDHRHRRSRRQLRRATRRPARRPADGGPTRASASSSGRSKTISPTRSRSTSPSGERPRSPQRSTSRVAHLPGRRAARGRAASVGQRRRAEPREGAQRLRLAGGDPAGQANEGAGRDRALERAGAGRRGSGGCVASGRTSGVRCRWLPRAARRPRARRPASAVGGVSGRLGAPASSADWPRARSARRGRPRPPRRRSPRRSASAGSAVLRRRLGEDLLGDVEVRDLVRRRLAAGPARRARAESGPGAAGSGTRRA